jgi:Transposase DDE domain
VFKDLLPQLQLNWQQRVKRPLPDSLKFALLNFERIWIADGSTLEALFRKLKSLEDLKTGQLAGKICTVIDLVTRLPIEVWFHTKPAASETNFEAALLNLLPPKTLVLLDRGFYHFLFLQQLINQDVHFITRLKAKASLKYLKIFSYNHSVKDRLIQLGTVRRGAPVLTLRLIESELVKLPILILPLFLNRIFYLPTSWLTYIGEDGELKKLFTRLNDCWGYLICGLVLLMVSSYKYGLLGYFMPSWLIWEMLLLTNYLCRLTAFLWR